VRLYLEVKVEMLHDAREIENVLRLLGDRGKRPLKHIEKVQGDDPQRIYRATPVKGWINSADQDEDGDFIRDYRIEVYSEKPTDLN
jgi:hypothetical protein